MEPLTLFLAISDLAVKKGVHTHTKGSLRQVQVVPAQAQEYRERVDKG